MLDKINYWWNRLRFRCYKCKTKFVDQYFCYTCGDWVYWWPNKGKPDSCDKCETVLNKDGYCSECNTFPYRKWIREEEALFVADIDFQRKDPDGYAAMERNSKKITVFYRLKENPEFPSKDIYRQVYGEEIFKEVEAELAEGLESPRLL